MFNLEEEMTRVGKANERWWIDINTGESITRSVAEIYALIASELSEALEGERKSLNDTHLPYHPMAAVEMADVVIRILDYMFHRKLKLIDMHNLQYSYLEKIIKYKKPSEIIWLMHRELCRAYEYYDFGEIDNEAEELSVIIGLARIYCEVFEYNFETAYNDKMDYNAQREDHKIEARRLADGKKF